MTYKLPVDIHVLKGLKMYFVFTCQQQFQQNIVGNKAMDNLNLTAFARPFSVKAGDLILPQRFPNR